MWYVVWCGTGGLSGLTFGVVDEGPVDVKAHLIFVPVAWEVPPARFLPLIGVPRRETE